jgi:hypothetical protein
MNLFRRYGDDHALFVTLTFPGRMDSIRTAQLHLNSVLNAVRKRHAGYIWVIEPHASGAIHIHLLIPVTFDTHDGTDLDAWARPITNNPRREQRRSMNAALRAEDDWWQATAPAYGFGRVDIAPVYGGPDAMRQYMSKAKWAEAMELPFTDYERFRFWGRSKSLKSGTIKFSWNGPKGRTWRRSLRQWALGYGCNSPEEAAAKFGPQWGYYAILDIEGRQRASSQ